MLTQLHISNYALIETLDIDFTTGMNVITGETGAGKSIIMGALGLVMGNRADSSAVREGAKKCVVEVMFAVDSIPPEWQDYDVEDELVLRREMTIQGKSRAFMNDTPVTLSQLKSIASQIIDIHSQHQNLLIERADFQLNIVDTFAKNTEQLVEYQSIYKEHKDLCRQCAELKVSIENTAKERDFDQYQFNQLTDAKLKACEQEELEEEQQRLVHAEEIKSALSNASEILNDDYNGVVSRLKECVQSLRTASKYMNETSELTDAVNNCYMELRELANDAERSLNSVSTDGQRLGEVESRLGELYDLQQKHHVRNCDELIDLQEQLRLKLEGVEERSDELLRLEKSRNEAEQRMLKAADALSLSRQSVKKKIEELLEERLIYLGIQNAKIEIQINGCDCNSNGCDEVEFLFSANKNSLLQPIGKIASGGEIARVMLALKTIIAESKGLQSIIFDEIDTGVSGEMATRMGEVMQQLSEHAQVITITHLPQIAAKGGTHYKVYKKDLADSTVTNITKLNHDERIKEIAEMLSGKNPTQTAIDVATELIN